MKSVNLFSERILRELIQRAAVGRVAAVQTTQGYVVVMWDPKGEQFLGTQRGGARVFKTLNAVAKLLTEMGAKELTVQFGAHELMTEGEQ